MPGTHHCKRTEARIASKNGVIILALARRVGVAAKRAMLAQIGFEQSDCRFMTTLKDSRPILGVASLGF
jgi:hypothetical protein